MKRLSSHFENYCRVSERQTGKRHYFAIKNSSQMNDVFTKLKGKAASFDSYDFSNIISSTRKSLREYFDLLFNNSRKTYINVSKNLMKVEYGDEILPVEQGWSFDRIKLKDAIKFLIKICMLNLGC